MKKLIHKATEEREEIALELDVDLEEDEEVEIMQVELYLIPETLNYRIHSSPNISQAEVRQRLQVL